MNENELIDESAAGSGRDGADGVQEQLTAADTLYDFDVPDPLDEGYTVPDREPSVRVPTEAEEREGLSIGELLRAEEPDVGVAELEQDRRSNLFDEVGGEVGRARSGRLVDADQGDYRDTDDELWAGDVGIDGAAASAEEAAVHVIDDEDGLED